MICNKFVFLSSCRRWRPGAKSAAREGYRLRCRSWSSPSTATRACTSRSPRRTPRYGGSAGLTRVGGAAVGRNHLRVLVWKLCSLAFICPPALTSRPCRSAPAGPPPRPAVWECTHTSSPLSGLLSRGWAAVVLAHARLICKQISYGRHRRGNVPGQRLTLGQPLTVSPLSEGGRTHPSACNDYFARLEFFSRLIEFSARCRFLLSAKQKRTRMALIIGAVSDPRLHICVWRRFGRMAHKCSQHMLGKNPTASKTSIISLLRLLFYGCLFRSLSV